MGAIDALNHLLAFFLPALALGGLSSGLAKLAWRSELRAASWSRLARWSAAACAIASLAGLVVFGRDGMMATYGMMVLASALALFWVGFGPGRQ
jgi:hypothetical protein